MPSIMCRTLKRRSLCIAACAGLSGCCSVAGGMVFCFSPAAAAQISLPLIPGGSHGDLKVVERLKTVLHPWRKTTLCRSSSAIRYGEMSKASRMFIRGTHPPHRLLAIIERAVKAFNQIKLRVFGARGNAAGLRGRYGADHAGAALDCRSTSEAGRAAAARVLRHGNLELLTNGKRRLEHR